jgi:NAD(P)-dependent dehydrogenase (short-subunit alcohol dehydrogenase family)
MTTDFAGSTALVTGATAGIGRATASLLASRGAHVIITGRNVERGEAAVASIRQAGGSADFLAAGLYGADSAKDLAARALDVASGRIDILVNNAASVPAGSTRRTTEEQFDAAFGINVKVPYFLVGVLAPQMASRGTGAIVNVLSVASEHTALGLGLYGATKAALQLFTKAWAVEYGPKGVRVNGVSPGPTLTEGTEPLGELLTQMAARGPANRVAAAEEIASAIVYLASPEASFIHGSILVVDGGRLAAG